MKNNAKWRFDDSRLAKVRRILAEAEVLDTLESCVEFLELLKEKKVSQNSLPWVVVDNAYHVHMVNEMSKGVSAGKFIDRYLDLIGLSQGKPAAIAEEDFSGEYGR